MRVAARAPVAVLALVLSACSARPGQPNTYGSPGGTPRVSGSPTRPATTASPTPSTPVRGGPPSTAGSTTAPVVPGSSRGYPDGGGVGAMALAYLRDDDATSLRVEVDYVEGRAPSDAALDHVAAILRRETDKPDGVVVERGNAIPPGDGSYTFREIARLEQEHRDHRSHDARATLWVVYLDGDLAGEQGALGVAYTASSAAIFRDRLGSAATSVIRPVEIERAVITHEVGHLLGLVNIGYTSPHDHEDPEHEGHSRYRDSVMYWQVEDVSISSLLSGGPPDDFDPFDRDDLRIRREG